MEVYLLYEFKISSWNCMTIISSKRLGQWNWGLRYWRGRASGDLDFFFPKFFICSQFWISISVSETSNHKSLEVKTVFLDSDKIQPSFALGLKLHSKAVPTYSRLQSKNFFLCLCNCCYIYSILATLPLEGFFVVVVVFLYTLRRHFRISLNWEQWILYLKEQAGFLEFWTLIFPILFISSSICLKIKVYFPPENPLHAAFCQVSELILWMMSL